MSILIRKGHVVDPANKRDGVFDILVEDGKIARVAKNINKKTETVIDAKNKIVIPGLIDMHAHLRDPGREDEETILTAGRAAVKGGFTSLCAMPNTNPPCDNQSIARFIVEEARKAGMVNVFPAGTITASRAGAELSEMADMKEAGCVAFSDDGDSVKNSFLMRTALEYASMLGVPLLSHCEDKILAQDGVMHEGYVSTVLGLKPIPSRAESTIAERDIELTAMAGARLHIQHVSAEETVKIIKEAKESGIKVTAEVTPHHLALTDAALKTYDTNTKVNPPLRAERDRRALVKALKEGIIDVIATDHAPHLESEKDVEFDRAPFGMIGLETALSVVIACLIETKILTWTQLVEKMSLNPAKILGLKKGTLSEGAAADITIIDPAREWVYEKGKSESKSSNSPFIGRTLKGLARDVIIGGRVVMKDGRLK